MGSRVFWALVFGFLAGVSIRSCFAIGWSTIAFFILLCAVPFAFVFLDRERKHTYLIAVVVLGACAFGMLRMQLATVAPDSQLAAAIGRQVLVAGVVAEEPDARETSTLVTIDTSEFSAGTSAMRVSSKLLARLPSHARISYGDRVRISGTLRTPEPFDTTSGRQFAYPEYLAAQGITFTLRPARVEMLQGNVGNPVRGLVFSAKENYLAGLRSVMPDPEAALGGGITVGDKRSLGPELTNDFQRDSLIHMVVLSGYNITVVLNAFTRALAGAVRPVQFAGSAFVVAAFILLSGGASSALRAGCMALIAVFARATHRVYLGERALAAVALALVAWNPWMLLFDPGFQLSALATLGLILFTPLFSRLFRRVPEAFGMREILASTCGTQLMVLPLLLYQNGTLSFVALPANVLALIPVPAAMFLSFIAALFGMLFGTSAAVIAMPAYALLWYIVSVAHVLASIPFAAVSIPAFGAWMVIAVYAIFAALYLRCYLRAV